MEQYNKVTAGGYVQVSLGERTVSTELSGDFSLPDYQPEIKRLLRVTASVLPSAKYIGGTECELSGSIDYYVLYTGSDNQIYCAPLEGEYKVTVPFEAGGESAYSALALAAEITPELVSGRVTSPRRLSIKCRLATRAALYGDRAVEDGFGMGEQGIQVLRGEDTVCRRLWGVGEPVTLTDEMIADRSEGELRVVMAEGKVMPVETTVNAGRASLRGELYIKLLLCKEDGGLPYPVLRKLPFFTDIPVEGAAAGDCAKAKGTVSEMSITVEDGRICISVGLLPEVEVAHKERIGYVKDIYSTERQTDCQKQRLTLPGPCNCFAGNFTLSDSKSLEEAGVSQGSRIIDADGRAVVESCRIEEGRCYAVGKAHFSLLCEKDGEYGTAELEFPFRYEAAAKDAALGVADAEALYARVRADGERVGVDCEIAIGGCLTDTVETEMLRAAVFGDPYQRTAGQITVCYPAGDDSLWSVAKHYGKGYETLAKENGLALSGAADSKESLAGASYLLID